MKNHYLILIIGIVFLSGCIGDNEGGGGGPPTTIAKECYNEGERFNTLETPDATCCEGLTRISWSFPEEPIGRPDSCVAPDCPCYICTKCGDGVCGEGENWCNCGEDCERPEEIPCEEDNGCGINSCKQSMNNCYEEVFSCKDGECVRSLSEYEDYYCVDDKCEDTCGNGVCDLGETKRWCPEDCS